MKLVRRKTPFFKTHPNSKVLKYFLKQPFSSIFSQTTIFIPINPINPSSNLQLHYSPMVHHSTSPRHRNRRPFLWQGTSLGNPLDLFAHNVLLNFHVQFDSLRDARILFDEMPDRNTVSLVTLLQGYTRSHQCNDAVELFSRLHREGHELNAFVFTTILKFLVTMQLEELGCMIHACVHKLCLDVDSFVGTALIDAYSVYGEVAGARRVFDDIVDRDMVSWTGMLACYAEIDCFEDAFLAFSLMRNAGVKPNNFTFPGVLKACIGLEAFVVGKAVHGCLLKMCYEQDSYVGTGLLELYATLGGDGDFVLLLKLCPRMMWFLGVS